jgi:ABC-type nitrate/sulfonate/bicarbonate transport system permease component
MTRPPLAPAVPWRGAVPFAALVAAWAVVTGTGLVPALFLPPPADVLRTAWDLARDGSLWINIAASLGRMLLGIVFSVPLAVALGILIALNRRVAPVVEPIVGFFNALSGIAWLPLAITWFGRGWTSVTVIMFD